MNIDDNGKPFTPEAMEAMRLRHSKSCVRCIACKALDWTSEPGEAQLAPMAGDYERRYIAILGPELFKRREEQDASHGGPTHDDTHTPEDWCRFIQDYAYRARISSLEVNESLESGIAVQLKPNQAEYEDKMKDVACLAISAILSSRRKCAQSNSAKQFIHPETFSHEDKT
jgi:hypothetical protein